jgi:hypothetical protein
MSLLVGLKAIETSQALDDAHARQYRGFAALALDEVRRLAMGLRPSVHDDLGLMPALERYAAEYMRTYGVAVDLHGQGLENRLPSTIEITLYRLIQEALRTSRSMRPRRSSASSSSISGPPCARSSRITARDSMSTRRCARSVSRSTSVY